MEMCIIIIKKLIKDCDSTSSPSKNAPPSQNKKQKKTNNLGMCECNNINLSINKNYVQEPIKMGNSGVVVMYITFVEINLDQFELFIGSTSDEFG